MGKILRGILGFLEDIFSVVVGCLQYVAIALMCYLFSFVGFLYFCTFMEWDIPAVFSMEKLGRFFGMENLKVTISALKSMDWRAWWADANVLNLIIYAIGLIIALGIIFAAFYIPYKAFLSALSDKLADVNYRLAKRLALLLSLISHPIIWYIGLHYAGSIATVFLVIVFVFLNLFIWSYAATFIGLVFLGRAGKPRFSADADADDKLSSSDAFSLEQLPFIVYDDNNDQWKRRGIYGDHAVYYNNSGDETIIYSAQVSGSSANTSAGTLHWY